jgi:hypothetical protein
MSNLQELIDADNENIAKSRKILTGFDPELSSSLDTAAAMFKTFSRCMKGALDDSADLADLHECAKELGVEPDALTTLIRSTAQGDPFLERARTVSGRLIARQARVIVFLLMQRQYMWAATDLLRGRLTPVVGYERLQAESVALLFLMRDDPTIGRDWLRITTPDKGMAFYRTHRKSITKLTESMGLGGGI